MSGNGKKDREKRHQAILEAATLYWLNKHPVWTCDVAYAAFHKAMESWLANHSDALLEMLFNRLSDEITAAETIPDEAENSC
jgi:hypothetical protein